MFSRAVRSMSKPAPNSISGAMVPLTVTLPALLIHAGNGFQQRGLAAAVQPNQTVEVTGHNIKRYIVQGKEFIKPDTAVQQRTKYSLRLSCLSLARLKRIETWSIEIMGFCSAISMPPYMYRTNLS